MNIRELTGVKEKGDLVAPANGTRLGVVISAGKHRYRVRWSTDWIERVEQGSPEVLLVDDEKFDRLCDRHGLVPCVARELLGVSRRAK